MGTEPFQSELTRYRAVCVPADLSDEKRAAFIASVRSAVRKQAALADECKHILMPVGEVREEGDSLIIEHEPASPFDLDAVLNASNRPDISTLWWLSWSMIQAMQAAGPGRVIHGGLQLRSLFIDRLGRLKLTDFELAPVFERVCGVDARSLVACEAVDDDAKKRGFSARWSLLSADDRRDNGWISPQFSPEILDGRTRLNPNADQFSLGIMLYLLATGVHPYGAELSEPDLIGYFLAEPYGLAEERGEWSEIFDRREAETVLSGDQPVIEWSDLVNRLLANETGGRFESLTEAIQICERFAPPSWQEANEVLGESAELLDQHQYDPFLTTIGPWSENAELPAWWRVRLTDRITEAEELKAVHAAHEAFQSRVEEGFAAIQVGQVDAARQIAGELLGVAGLTEQEQARLSELQRAIDEYQELIIGRADELAATNLESAREALEQLDFNSARMILTGMLDDPLTSPERRQETEALLTETDELETRVRTQTAEFEAFKAHCEQGNIEAAFERGQTLLADATLADAIRTEAQQRFDQLVADKRRRDEYLAVLGQVEDALDRGDLAAAEETLSTLPLESRDAELVDRRSAIAEACEQLRRAHEQQSAIEELLRSGEAEAALTAAGQLAATETWSKAAQSLIEALVNRCETAVEQSTQEAIEDALSLLDQAEQAWQAGDVDGCRRILDAVLPLKARFEPADRERADRLDAGCVCCQQAIDRLKRAERMLDQHKFAAADECLIEIEIAKLPADLATELASLRERIEQARTSYVERLAAECDEKLAQIEELLIDGNCAEANSAMRSIAVDELLPAQQRERLKRVRGEVERQQNVADTLETVRQLVDQSDPTQASLLLTELAGDGKGKAGESAIPTWALSQVDDLRKRIAELREAERAAALGRAAKALDAAEHALGELDHRKAVKLIADAEASSKLSPELLARHENLTGQLSALEVWVPRLAGIETSLSGNRLAEAHKAAEEASREVEQAPAAVGRRLRSLMVRVKEGIESRRKAIDDQLAGYESELAEKGARARSLLPKVEALATDPLTSKQQRESAANLAERLRELKPPKSPLPKILAGVAAVAVIAVGGWFALSGGEKGGGDGQVTPPVVQDRPEEKPTPPRVVETEPPKQEEDNPPPPLEWPDALAARVIESPSAADLMAILSAAGVVEAGPPGEQITQAAERVSRLQVTEADDQGNFELRMTRDDGEVVREAFRLTESGQAWTPGTRNGSAGQQLLAMVLKPVEPEPPIEPPPAEESPWPASLKAGTIASDSLPAVLRLLAGDETGDLLAQVTSRATLGERTPDDTVALTLGLLAGAGSVSGQFALVDDEGWKAAPENNDSMAALLSDAIDKVKSRVQAVAKTIRDEGHAGNLASAYAEYARVDALQPILKQEALQSTVAEFASVLQGLPPKWDPADAPAGFAAGNELDEATGYPTTLSKDNRTLRLVSVPPASPIWQNITGAVGSRQLSDAFAGHALAAEAAGPESGRSWRLFYIDAAEWNQPVDGDDPVAYINQVTSGDPRTLPTVDEWLLAALSLSPADANASGFLAGKYWEWCADSSGSGKLWVCGGCDSLHKQARISPPAAGASFSDVWTWLNNALVSQTGRRGSEVTGVRMVLRIAG